MKIHFLFVLGSLATSQFFASDAAATQAFSAQYQASYKGISATAHMRVAPAKSGNWLYTMSIDHMLANLSQATVFQDLAGQLRPVGGSDITNYASIKRRVTTSYNWNVMRAIWSGDVKPTRAGPVGLQAGDMDALLINLAIARDAAAARPMNYRMVENGRARPQHYRVVGREAVSISGKSHQAIKVAQGNANKQLLAWVVPGIPVPVKLVQRENGSDVISLQMRSWSK